MFALLLVVILGVVIGVSLWAWSAVYTDEGGRPWHQPDSYGVGDGRQVMVYVRAGRYLIPKLIDRSALYEEPRERWRR